MSRSLLVFAILLLPILSLLANAQFGPKAAVDIKVVPARPLIEHRGTQQFLNFDFLLQSTGADPLHLNRVQVSHYADMQGKVCRTLRKSKRVKKSFAETAASG